MKRILWIAVLLIPTVIISVLFMTNEKNLPLNEEITVSFSESTTFKSYDLVKALNKCTTLGDIVTDINLSSGYSPEIFSTDFWAYYEEDGKETVTYSIAVTTIVDLAEFIISNSDKAAVDTIAKTGERLRFEAYIKRQKCDIYLTNDGFLFISCNNLTKAFKVGKEAYQDYMNNLCAVVWTPEAPVTFG